MSKIEYKIQQKIPELIQYSNPNAVSESIETKRRLYIHTPRNQNQLTPNNQSTLKHKASHQSHPNLLPVPSFEPFGSFSRALFGVISSTDSMLLRFVLEFFFALVDASDVFFACGPQGLLSQLFGILRIIPRHACPSLASLAGLVATRG